MSKIKVDEVPSRVEVLAEEIMNMGRAGKDDETPAWKLRVATAIKLLTDFVEEEYWSGFHRGNDNAGDFSL